MIVSDIEKFTHQWPVDAEVRFEFEGITLHPTAVVTEIIAPVNRGDLRPVTTTILVRLAT